MTIVIVFLKDLWFSLMYIFVDHFTSRVILTMIQKFFSLLKNSTIYTMCTLRYEKGGHLVLDSVKTIVIKSVLQ